MKRVVGADRCGMLARQPSRFAQLFSRSCKVQQWIEQGPEHAPVHSLGCHQLLAWSLIEPVCAPLAVDIMDGLAVVSLPPATRYTRMAWSSGLVERDALSYL